MRRVSEIDDLALSWWIFPVACALVVIGVKCWIIARYGNPTPFWDQWDADGALLFPRFFNGTLHFSDLIAAHNEHRILLTRLWSLLLLELEGYWDPIGQMVANTLLLGAFVAFFIAVFRPIVNSASWIVFALTSMVIFSYPFGWENTLEGFNSQWYFLLLFSLAGLATIVDAVALTPRWWAAVLLMVVSYFCMASGMVTLAAALAICLIQYTAGRRSGWRELLAAGILAAVILIMLHDTPVSSGQAQLKAHSVGQFLRALLEITSWPLGTGRTVAIMLASAVITYAPLLLASFWIIGQRPPFGDRRWLLVTLAGWATMLEIAVAYDRATGPLASRYQDMYAIALLLSCLTILYLLKALLDSLLGRRLALTAVALWLLLFFFGATRHAFRQSAAGLHYEERNAVAETRNLRDYLETGDIAALENKPPMHIPYPNPKRLAAIVSQPVIRALLPSELVGEASVARAQQHGMARYTGHAVETIKEYMLRWGVLLVPIGIVLILTNLLQLRRRFGCK